MLCGRILAISANQVRRFVRVEEIYFNVNFHQPIFLPFHTLRPVAFLSNELET